MRLRLYEQIKLMLEVLLHRLHPLMSLDCHLAIRHKKWEYIEIGGDERFDFLAFGYRLYFREI